MQEWSYPSLVDGLGLSLFDAHFVDLFVVDGGSIVESGVSTMGVVPRLGGLEDSDADVGLGTEPGAIEELALQGGEEGLGHGVVIAIPDRAH